VPLIEAVFTVVPDVLDDDEPAAGVLVLLAGVEPDELVELPQAATASTAAASPATLNIFLMSSFSSYRVDLP
jgi:hypothetical protein